MGIALLIALTMENYKKMLVVRTMGKKDVKIPLINKHESVAWQYYIAFTLPWDILGEKEQVYKTNRNIGCLRVT